jgi:hypothetical protein
MKTQFTRTDLFLSFLQNLLKSNEEHVGTKFYTKVAL